VKLTKPRAISLLRQRESLNQSLRTIQKSVETIRAEIPRINDSEELARANDALAKADHCRQALGGMLSQLRELEKAILLNAPSPLSKRYTELHHAEMKAFLDRDFDRSRMLGRAKEDSWEAILANGGDADGN
jgi:hypothetical protein